MRITPATYDEWAGRAAGELSDRPIEDIAHDYGGLSVRPVYFANDLPETAAAETPGVPPFTRGIRATMYANRPWTIRQYAGFSTARESNEFFRRALADGQNGLSVAFDLATHRGYDSDHPRVASDVGKAGVAIDTIEDMKILFDGIPLDQMSVSMTMNGAVIPIMAMFIAAAEEQNISKEKLSGTIQNDILKEFMVRNTYIYPPEASMRIVGDVIAYAAKNLPKFNSISISGYHIHEAGATAVQELAFTLADGMEYVRAASARGLDIDAFADRLSFFFGVGMNFFVEIAKLRAARQLWAGIMRDLGAKQERSLMLRTHCQTSGVSLTEQEPHNNVVRTAFEAMAAVLGGTQSLHTNSFDEAIALPTEFSARIARNTQLIIQHETRVPDVVDPLGGSYYVEALTAKLVAQAGAMIAEIEKAGGMIKAVQGGRPKLQIEEAAAIKQARVDRGKEIIVGVNQFCHEDNERISIREIDNDRVRKEQVARLEKIKRTRNQAKVDEALARLSRCAETNGDNLLFAAINAARVRATVGEISTAMENVFGRYSSITQVVSGVYDKQYEGDPEYQTLKQRIALLNAARGKKVSIFIAKLGQDGHDRGAKIIATAFADIGFAVHIGALFETPEEVAIRVEELGVDVVGISSLAAAHNRLVPELINDLRKKNLEEVVVIVGGVIPKTDHEYLRKAGVGEIFGPGTNVLEAAFKVLNLIEGRLTNR